MNDSCLKKKYALITGGAGGLGLATSQFLVSQGWEVYVADSNQHALHLLNNETGISPLLMDVTQASSIQSVFDTLQKEIPHLDAIINFAGILRIGSMAEMSEQTLAMLMDINVMGTFRVNKIFFPLINTVNSQQQKGRIINISSETGWQSGAPFNGAYAMSKHAIEAYSDALRRELQLLDIPVIKIQPGPFKTNMVASIEENFAKAAADSQFFSQHLTRVKRFAMNEQNKAHSPLLLAKVIYQALSVKKPKAAYSVKPDLARSFLEYLPTSLVDWILKKVLSN